MRTLNCQNLKKTERSLIFWSRISYVFSVAGTFFAIEIMLCVIYSERVNGWKPLASYISLFGLAIFSKIFMIGHVERKKELIFSLKQDNLISSAQSPAEEIDKMLTLKKHPSLSQTTGFFSIESDTLEGLMSNLLTILKPKRSKRGESCFNFGAGAQSLEFETERAKITIYAPIDLKIKKEGFSLIISMELLGSSNSQLRKECKKSGWDLKEKIVYIGPDFRIDMAAFILDYNSFTPLPENPKRKALPKRPAELQP